VKICAKVFMQKRIPYDSAAARARDSELADFIKPLPKRKSVNKLRNTSKGIEKVQMSAILEQATRMSGNIRNEMCKVNYERPYNTDKPPRLECDRKTPKWKSKSDEFREAMKIARRVAQAEKQSKVTGIPLHELLPSISSTTTKPVDYITCPTCGRSFNEQSGSRHIPQVMKLTEDFCLHVIIVYVY